MHDPPSTAYDPTACPFHPSRRRRKARRRALRLQRSVPAASLAWSRRFRPVMGALVALALSMGLISGPIIVAPATRAQIPAHSPSIDRFANFIVEASARFAVPAQWVRAVMQIESGGDEHATSPRGAMGLMQLMPATWVELSVRYGLGADPFDAHDNIIAGTAYLKDMHDRFGSAGFLAAYHAGPRRYEQHLATGQPLPTETAAYVTAVTPLLGDRQDELTAIRIRRAVPWREGPLFVERRDAP